MPGIADHDRPADQVWLFHHQVDGLFLGQPARAEVARFVRGAAFVEEGVEVGFVDELLEQGAGRRLLRQVVALQIDAVLFEVGDRLPAGGSTRLEINVGLRHDAARLTFPGCCYKRRAERADEGRTATDMRHRERLLGGAAHDLHRLQIRVKSAAGRPVQRTIRMTCGNAVRPPFARCRSAESPTPMIVAVSAHVSCCSRRCTLMAA